MKRGATQLKVTCSLASDEIVDLLHQRLDRHQVKFTATSHSEHIRGTVTFSYGHEVLDVIIADPSLLRYLLLAAATAAGVSVGGALGKVLEAAATELGKDLYRWLKEALTTVSVCDEISVSS